MMDNHAQRSTATHAEIDSIVDDLHGQLVKDTEVLASNFSKVYESAEGLLRENRKKNAKARENTATPPSRSGKPALQTAIYDAFTSIHTLQATSINPVNDFSHTLSAIANEKETEVMEFLSKADSTYDSYRKSLLDKIVIERSKAKELPNEEKQSSTLGSQRQEIKISPVRMAKSFHGV